jgi:hypothetical protein
LAYRVKQSLELYTEFLTSVNNLRIVFRIKTYFLHFEVKAACLSAVFDCTSGFPLLATIFYDLFNYSQTLSHYASGKLLYRFCVNANKALATAGAKGGTPGSPTPAGTR